MFKSIARSFLDLIYPPLCHHCRESLLKEEQVFCSTCLSELVLINPINRCPFCFSESEMAKMSACLECRRHPPILTRFAAACEEQGAATTLLKQLKSGTKPSAAKGAGALMAAQFLNLAWPFPDLIVPVPTCFTHWLKRGFNQSRLLADAIATILERPVQDLLKRKSGDYSQSALSRTQRQALTGERFSLKGDIDVKGKTLLLIDDSLTTGTTLRRCAELLMEEQPKAIYGLVFCRGM